MEFIKETEVGIFRARITPTKVGFVLEYFKPGNTEPRIELLEGRSLEFARAQAAEWINSIVSLNG